MKCAVFVSLLFLILHTSKAVKPLDDVWPTAEKTLTACGETMTADSGFIEYKLNETYLAGEICAFIIQMESYNGCNFTLETHGINDPDWEAITIYTLTSTEKNLTAVHLGPDRPRSAYIDSSSFIVVFNPKTDLGTGFRLKMESGTTRPINRIFTTPLVFNNERLYPLVFPLKVAAVAEWNPVVITSKAQLLTDEAFELVLTGNYTSDVYGCSFWYFIHTLKGGNLQFIDAYPDMKPGEERRFQSQGLFIVVFFKNEKCKEEDTGALDWFERVLSK